MKRLLFILLPVLFNIHDTCIAQTERFLGTYLVSGICEYGWTVEDSDIEKDNHVYPCDPLDIEIEKGIDSDILLKGLGADAKAYLSGLELTIPYFEWTEIIGKQWGLDGHGKFENDSLFLNITSYGDCNGPIRCALKGGKIKLDIRGNVSCDANCKIYFDAKTQCILFDTLLEYGIFKFELADAMGKLVLVKSNANGSPINISQLPNGLYVYRLSTNGYILYNGKILKNN